MNVPWTESLTPALAKMTAGRDWDRVQEAACGDWLLLSPVGSGDSCWYQVENGMDRPRALSPLEDPELPVLRQVVDRWLRRGREFRLLAWRIGRRAVFRLSRGQSSRICKLYRRERHTLTRWQVTAEINNDRWRAPNVLAWDPSLRRLDIEFLPGTSLNTRWLAGRAEFGDGVHIASLLDWLAGCPVPRGFPVYEVEDEVLLLQRRLAEYQRTLAAPPARTGETVSRVIRALRELTPVPNSLCHRDLHDKQILLDGDRGGLIDFDLAAAGHPALDAGNILAHLRLRAMKGAQIPWRDIVSTIVDNATPTRSHSLALRVWTASALMRLTLIYARRRRPPELLEALETSTRAALEGRGEWNELV
ncbi:MAG: phosphotransferase [Acidobacteriota bacterium]|nr:phosphotransferase [Acidobacteriota bacterium]